MPTRRATIPTSPLTASRQKASYDVKEGDIIEISFGERRLRVKVLDVKEHTLKADASSLYEVIA